jgi:hypothetical protein
VVDEEDGDDFVEEHERMINVFELLKRLDALLLGDGGGEKAECENDERHQRLGNEDNRTKDCGLGPVPIVRTRKEKIQRLHNFFSSGRDTHKETRNTAKEGEKEERKRREEKARQREKERNGDFFSCPLTSSYCAIPLQTAKSTDERSFKISNNE